MLQSLNAVWSRRHPLANAGAVLSLLDGPDGCDAGYCVVWFPFRMEVGRIYRLLDLAQEGTLGMGLFICLLQALLEKVLCGTPHAWLDARGSARVEQFGWACAAFQVGYSECLVWQGFS